MPWRPGESGNPKRGRPKTAAALTVIARRQCRRAIGLCVRYLNDEEAAPKIRLQAASMLLDRGLGKPPQGVSAAMLTDEELVGELMLRKRMRDADAARIEAGAGLDAEH